ncbi:hypothetical protein GALMADRAFT_139853 [Galerina marginata CBS 339.88]|uniref:Uncharacterized protein n=1 Tax=Galerina marginata (strain CBS 339.88) TaxID=685588 RepID=A0A067TAT0_GALM3|nr:hypothetical protein GALMADRAFT_139853 [Galerina marginata CBS 339.88]
MGDLIGVLHVAGVDGEVGTPDLASVTPEPQLASDADSDSKQKPKKVFSLEELEVFIKKFPANKNEDDPSALFVWSCESYVIRALAHLCEEGAFELPCKPEEMHEYTKRRIVVLKASPATKDVISVIPFAE